MSAEELRERLEAFLKGNPYPVNSREATGYDMAQFDVRRILEIPAGEES